MSESITFSLGVARSMPLSEAQKKRLETAIERVAPSAMASLAGEIDYAEITTAGAVEITANPRLVDLYEAIDGFDENTSFLEKLGTYMATRGAASPVLGESSILGSVSVGVGGGNVGSTDIEASLACPHRVVRLIC